MSSIIEITNSINFKENILDRSLLGYSLTKTKFGRPLYYCGGNCVVFQLIDDKGNRKAYRIYHHEPKDIENRYKISKNYLLKTGLPYFIEFDYMKEGLKLADSVIVPAIRMEWVEGHNLRHYIENLIQTQDNNIIKEKLSTIAKTFLEMTQQLHENKISHCELFPENILINEDGKIKLIDYDSLYVPGSEFSPCVYHIIYHHPKQIESNSSGMSLDYFSELILYIEIMVLAEAPNLWSKYKNEIGLLFGIEKIDIQSVICKDIQSLGPDFSYLINLLGYYLSIESINELKPLNELIK